MCVQRKKTAFFLFLLMMSFVAGIDNCQSEGNVKTLSFYSENFEKGNLIVPKKPHCPKQDWDKNPQGPIQNKKFKFSISSFSDKDDASISKDMRSLFYNNEYGRD